MKLLDEINILWRWIKPFKKQVWLILSLGIISGLISAIIPYLYGNLVDSVSKHRTIEYILGLLAGWFVLSLISDYISRFNMRKGNKVATQVESSFVTTLVNYLLSVPLAYHHNKKMGGVMRKIDNAGGFLGRLTEEVVFYTLPQILTVVIALGFLFYINYLLCIPLAIILVAYTIATVYKTKPIIKENDRMNKIYEKAYGDLYDSVSNIQVVKSNTNEEFEQKRNRKNFDTIVSSSTSFMWLWSNLNFWQQTIFSIGFVGLFGLAIFLLRAGQVSTGNLVTFVGYIALVYAPFSNLGNYYRVFKRGIDSISRGAKILDEETEHDLRTGKDIITEMKGNVELKHVSYAYNNKKMILKDININIKSGEVIALVGKTGSGKSTLVDMLSGYHLPTKGKILIDGKSLSSLAIFEYRKNIAYVPQESSLFNDTVKNNIRYAKLNATQQEIEKASIAANADDFILKLPKKYNTIVGERGVKLSVGQKQRVAIARAILRDPKILILDEATSSLDSITEKLVQEALDRLIVGRTTFVIAHRLSTVVKADRIIVLDGGRIVEMGTHQDLLKNKNGHYNKLYTTQTTIV